MWFVMRAQNGQDMAFYCAIACLRYVQTNMFDTVVILQGFVLGKLDFLTVSLGKLKFASVTDFSLSKLPQERFIVWGLKTAREQKNVLWISLVNYPRAEKGKNQIPEQPTNGPSSAITLVIDPELSCSETNFGSA